jgi:Na+/H+-dicarboxylate symporter
MLLALAAGIAVGLAVPGRVSWLQPLGTLFVEMLKTIMLPIVVSMLVTAVASMPREALSRAGRRMLAWGLAASLFASAAGVIVAAAIRPGRGLTLPAGAAHPSPERPPGLLETIVPGNVVAAAVQGNVLGVLCLAGAFALALNQLRGRGSSEIDRAVEDVVRLTRAGSEALTIVLGWIMVYAPIGVFALTALTVAQNGPAALVPFVKVHAAMDLGMLIVTAAGLTLLHFRGVTANRFVRAIQTPVITAFSTQSSAATLPAELACAREDLRLPARFSGFAIPIAVSLTKVGTAVFIGVMAVFAANVAEVPLSPRQAGLIVLATFVASIATAPISGGAMLQMAVVFQQAGLPLGAIPLLAGIPFAGKLNTVMNVAGHLALATAVAQGQAVEADPGQPSS